MRAELANLNDCAVPFLSRAAVILWCTIYSIQHVLYRIRYAACILYIIHYTLYNVYKTSLASSLSISLHFFIILVVSDQGKTGAAHSKRALSVCTCTTTFPRRARCH